MPAKTKYLTTSTWQRFAKITAGIFGGYIISASLHMVLALWLPCYKTILISSVYSLFLIWMLLLILAFLFKSGWKVLGLYFLFILILVTAIYFGKLYCPIV